MTILVDGLETNQVPVTDRGFQYGDGVFETLAVLRGMPLLWERHWQRLSTSCARLSINPPAESELYAETQRVVGQAERSVVKIILTRAAGGQGYALTATADCTRVVMAKPWPTYPLSWWEAGVRVRWCETRLSRQPRLAGMKHLNRLEQVLARSEWPSHSEDAHDTLSAYAEGLVCDQEDFVIEGTMSNVFIINDDTLLTPDLSQSGVAGVMRAQVLDSAHSLGMDCQETWLTRAQVENAQALFLTNSLIGIWPVKTLGARSYTFEQIKTISKIRHAIAQFQCFKIEP